MGSTPLRNVSLPDSPWPPSFPHRPIPRWVGFAVSPRPALPEGGPSVPPASIGTPPVGLACSQQQLLPLLLLDQLDRHGWFWVLNRIPSLR